MRNNLTRADIAATLEPLVALLRRDRAALVDQVIDEIVETLARGEEVKLSGFGAFVIRAKAERMGRNPRNGAPAKIGERRVVAFRPSRLLRARLNGRGSAEAE